MIAENLKKLILNPSKFLQKIYLNKKDLDLQKGKYENHLRKFKIAASLVVAKKERNVPINEVDENLNDDILDRYDALPENEKKSLTISGEIKKVGREKPQYKKCVITLKKTQRLGDENYISKPKDTQVLLIFLEIPFDQWDQYYNILQNQEDAQVQAVLPAKQKDKKLHQLQGCWNGYISDPAEDKVYQVPFYFEINEMGNLMVYTKGINSELYEGIAELLSNYLVCTLVNTRKTNAINLQTFIKDSMLSEDIILNTACIWIQVYGKPLLSILILYKSKKHFTQHNLPDLEVKEIKMSADIDIHRVNHFIEYVSRKSMPELAARWFKPNKLEVVKKRNKSSKIVVEMVRPREEFNNLCTFFSKSVHNGQWWSFSRIHNDLNPKNKRVSVFKWSFIPCKNRKIIEVHRLSRLSDDSEYEGIIQVKQKHISIFFSSDNGYKHFLCPFIEAQVSTGDENGKSTGSSNNTVLLGTSSTLHQDTSYLVKEMLVYTNRLDKRIIKDGFISLEKFLQFDFLDQVHKDYISNRDTAVLYSKRAF